MPNLKLPRPMEVCTALRRLGYLDKPSVGDHVKLFKKLDHPDGPMTVQTGIDPNSFGRSDVDRIRERTKLEDDDLWERALKRKLTKAEYDKHLTSFPRSELVIPFWRDKLS